MRQFQAFLGLALVASTGCSFYARGPEEYRKVTRSLLDGRRGDVESCYMRQVQGSEQIGGTVVVAFHVKAKTGAIVDPKVVAAKTNASDALQQCVLDSLAGLKLDPADQRTGEATFKWEFAAAKL